jgi:hypothetical protein
MGLIPLLCLGSIAITGILIIMCSILNYYLIAQKHVNITQYADKVNNTDLIINSIYFTFTTLSSVGYGDILPITNTGKMAVALQQMLVLLVSIGLLKTQCDK